MLPRGGNPLVGFGMSIAHRGDDVIAAMGLGIGFPRGMGTMLPRYAAEVSVNAVGLDWMVDPAFAREQVQTKLPVQGNLDPLALLAGGAVLDHGVDVAIEAFSGGPFIFNLGHGIVPETPIAHVEQMLRRVRQQRG